MKEKVIVIFCAYLFFVFWLSVSQSCESVTTYESRICDIEFKGVVNNMSGLEPDTMSSNIGFVVLAYPNKNCYNSKGFNIISSCYATTKCAKWQNELMQSSFKLCLDKNIVLLKDTIAANSNLFSNEKFNSGVQISKGITDCKHVEYSISFADDLKSNLSFENGIYNVSFECITNDGKTFQRSRQVVFKP